MSDEAKTGSLPPPPDMLSIMQASLDADEIGGGVDPVVEVKSTEAPKTDATKQPEVKEAEAAKVEPDSSLKETEKKSEDKPKSKYATEAERRGVTWDKINERKAAIDAKEKALADREAELHRATVKSQPFRDQHGNTAEAYEAFAAQAEAAGEKANAESAMKMAQEVRAAEQQAKQKAAADDHNSKWAKNYETLTQAHPDLKNKESDMYKDTVALINKHPLLTQDPNGISLAVEAVLINRKAKEIETVSAENKSLKEKIQTLEKKLSLSSGLAAEAPETETEFNKLSESAKQARIMDLLGKELSESSL